MGITSLGQAKSVEAPDATKYPHTARWYRHILSYAAEHSSLPAGTNLFNAINATATSSSANAAPAAEEDEDDIDLFGDDDEEDPEAAAEAERIKQERVAKYTAEKEAKKQEKLAAGKTLEVAKSVVTLQVKPWDDETDMEAMEKSVREIEKDGLVWGKSKLVPVGYGEFKAVIHNKRQAPKYQADPKGQEECKNSWEGGTHISACLCTKDIS